MTDHQRRLAGVGNGHFLGGLSFLATDVQGGRDWIRH
jgi:hypothetical protein